MQGCRPQDELIVQCGLGFLSKDLPSEEGRFHVHSRLLGAALCVRCAHTPEFCGNWIGYLKSRAGLKHGICLFHSPLPTARPGYQVQNGCLALAEGFYVCVLFIFFNH